MAVDIFEMLLAGSGKASIEYVQQMAGTGGANNPDGACILDGTGKIDPQYLPSYIDDVIEGYYNPVDGQFYENWNAQDGYTDMMTGEPGKIYIDIKDNNNVSYRWCEDQEHPDGFYVAIGTLNIATTIDANSTNEEVAGAAAVYDAVTSQNVKINIITDADSTHVDNAYYVYLDTFSDGIYGFRFSNDHTEILMTSTQEPGTGVTIFRGSEQNLMIMWTHANGNRYAKFIAYKGNANENYNDLVLYKIGNTGGKSYNTFINVNQETTTVDNTSTDAQIPTAKAVYDAIQTAVQQAVYVDPNEVIS